MDTELRVLHVCTGYSGGAGVAARRLNSALQKAGIHSQLLVMHSGDSVDSINYTTQKQSKRQSRRAKRGYQLFRWHRFRDRAKGVKGEYEIFSTPLTSQRVELNKLVREADIVHLHWIANFINFPSFFDALSSKPLVWTLHDMNPFLGGFHYKSDVARNPHLEREEAYLTAVKRKAYASLSSESLQLICPSRWLKQHAEESEVFERFQFHQIANCLDQNIFSLQSRVAARRELGISCPSPLVLFGSESLGNARKGFNILLESLKIMQAKGIKLELLTFGKPLPESESLGFRVHNLGRLDKQDEIARAYNAADITILPSIEDNLPNVMLESLSCGTPVVSFATGGMLEHITSGFSGEIVDEPSALALALGIETAISSHYDRLKIRAYAERKFSEDSVAGLVKSQVYKCFT